MVRPFFYLAGIGLSLGCASTPDPVHVPDPSTGAPPDVVVDPAVTVPSSFRYRSGTFHYDVQQTTIVTVGGSDNAAVEDTVLTLASIAYSISTTEGQPIVLATVDSMRIVSTRDTMLSPRLLHVPVMVELSPRPDPPDPRIMPSGDSTDFRSSCDTMEDAARALARDAHLQLPAVVNRGQSWIDSSSVAFCRGGIVMTAVTVSVFETVDLSSAEVQPMIGVMRRSEINLNGSGMQGVRQVAISGDGTSETLFSYDLQQGHLVESNGQSFLRLKFETVQQTEEVTQRSNSRALFRLTGIR